MAKITMTVQNSGLAGNAVRVSRNNAITNLMGISSSHKSQRRLCISHSMSCDSRSIRSMIVPTLPIFRHNGQSPSILPHHPNHGTAVIHN